MRSITEIREDERQQTAFLLDDITTWLRDERVPPEIRQRMEQYLAVIERLELEEEETEQFLLTVSGAIDQLESEVATC